MIVMQSFSQIIGAPGTQILLHFKQFELFKEDSEEACNDSVEIYDVFSPNTDNEISRLQGNLFSYTCIIFVFVHVPNIKFFSEALLAHAGMRHLNKENLLHMFLKFQAWTGDFSIRVP